MSAIWRRVPAPLCEAANAGPSSTDSTCGLLVASMYYVLCQLLVGAGIGATWPEEDKWNQLDSDSER